MAFTGSIFWVSGDFGVDDHTEIAEGLIEHFLIDLWIEISNKKIGSNVLGSFILGGFIDFDGFSEHFDHVHDFNRVVCVLLAFELNKAIALMLIGDFISWQMDINYGPALNEEFPEEIFGDFLVEVADVDGCLLISFV